MKKINREGGMPAILKSFMTGIQSGENENTEVFECKYQEIIDKAQEEKLEPVVIIDKKTESDKAYLCALGASVRTTLISGLPCGLKPVFYFAELDEPRRKQYSYELRKARAKVIKQHEEQLEVDRKLKEAARKGVEERRNGQARPN